MSHWEDLLTNNFNFMRKNMRKNIRKNMRKNVGLSPITHKPLTEKNMKIHIYYEIDF